PNVTGSLHMGHALNATIQDVLIRWKRMSGFKALWVPGTDHAGIATQNVVEKRLKKEGKTRFNLGREKFVEEVWQWKKESGDQILNQLKRLGASCDWSRTAFTMDENYSAAVLESFRQYHEQDWVYRGERVVNWCPRCQTSLSDLELEYKDEPSSFWYLKYPIIASSQYMVMATTRPETMLGDTAVAINPKDKRYKALVGQKVLLPLANREIPIIADSLIDVEFGTGAVKVTPAHSLDDWQIGQRHKLEMISVIDEWGRMNQNAPAAYQGMKTGEARKKIVADLTAQGLLEKIEPYTHSVPKCYRCDSTVELIPSKQWFIKMEELAKMAMKPVKKGEIKFHPKRWSKVYFDWLSKTRDWCISRQIWWGHQLPVWFCRAEPEKYAISIERPAKCSICGSCEMKRSEDVFDTWFSSALWPMAVLGWPKKTTDLATYYPTDVLSTARDIINLWVARMVYSSLNLVKKVPFKNVLIHATVVTKDGQRMSKSLGTGINPLDLVEKYGADATRFGLAWQVSESQDMRFGEGDILAGKKFCNKVWNASRFVLGQIESGNNFDTRQDPKPITEEDKKILVSFKKIISLVGDDLVKYQLGQALREIYHFFWHEFCDVYIEAAKKQIQEPQSEKEAVNTKKLLIYILANSLKLLHPFMPFITEEIYQSLPGKNKQVLMVEEWPKVK
ncbi:MAG: valine--tRNA ligase, partial [Patescibacteria group bacterium]